MIDNKKTAVALGYFDGVHLGHEKVLRAALENPHGFTPVVLLFDEHPQKVLFNRDVPFIMTPSDRDSILEQNGFKTLTLPFRNICNLSPEQFVDDILVTKLNAGFVSCGFNYSFGIKGSGNSDKLKELCEERGIKVCVCDEVTLNGSPVSSTLIREYISDGKISAANILLGRNYSFSTEVFSGDKRGRKLGFPTVNQYMPTGMVIPKFGVYASVVQIDGRQYYGVSNVGNRPTFDGVSVRCETYILDYSGDLYGNVLKTSLLEFVRPEMKFEDISDLIGHITHDANYVREKYIEKRF